MKTDPFTPVELAACRARCEAAETQFDYIDILDTDLPRALDALEQAWRERDALQYTVEIDDQLIEEVRRERDEARSQRDEAEALLLAIWQTNSSNFLLWDSTRYLLRKRGLLEDGE